MKDQISSAFINELKESVNRHPVLKNDWLQERTRKMSRQDLLLFLTQEYYVSVDFVNWFLLAASATNDLSAKAVLIENIWEEMGQGDIANSHVRILESFLLDIGYRLEENRVMEKTSEYLDEMKKIINTDFFAALGALGPANEYLLKLEYGIIYDAYNNLRKEDVLPEASFFEVNLTADLSHSEKMFRLIDTLCDNNRKKENVRRGNERALDARLIFYDGLMSGSSF